ncbi:MAG: Fic family protein [Smithella sp.]|nr:Fic family protein [Smithella sp.]
MKSLDRDFLERQSIAIEFAGTLRLLGEYRGQQDLLQNQIPQALNTLRQTALIQSAESSNRIEGITVEEERLRPLLEKDATPRNQFEAEIIGYKNVLAWIQNMHSRIDLVPDTILKMHRDMLSKTDMPAGRWKRRDNTIEERLSDGRWITRYVPVSAGETPFYMQELCSRFTRFWEEGRIDYLLLTYAFVLDFLCIHPFTDGNGRVSRLLTTLLLHHGGYEVVRYISLERLIEESKGGYYDVLNRVSEKWHTGGHSIIPWWEYNLGLLIAAYKEFENRVNTARSNRGSKTACVQEAVKHLPVEFEIREVVQACPGVSRPMIRTILEHLREEGKLDL